MEAIGICVIQPNFLPDNEIRFMALNDLYSSWGARGLLSTLQRYKYLYNDYNNHTYHLSSDRFELM